MHLHLRLFVVALLTLALCERAAAQTLWGEIELPGGAAAARRLFALGDEKRSDDSFLLDFTRRYYGAGASESQVARDFARYITHIDRLTAALRAWPTGLQLSASTLQRGERERWRDLCELVGLRLREIRNRPVVEPATGDDAILRASWAQAIGIDRATVAAELNAGRTVRVSVPNSILPLPLPAIWQQLLGDRSDDSPIARLLTSRSAALLYVGLTALDEETLGFIGARPDFLRRLSENETAVLAAFGHRLRVRNSSIVTPGDPADAALWEALVDSPAHESEQFIRNWLRRDDGRIAYFYDAISRLRAGHQRWIVMRTGDDKDRVRNVRRVYQHFARADPEWRIPSRPFYRPVDDPALALSIMDVADDGTVAPTWWPPLLERITNGNEWPDEPASRLRDTPATSDWVLGWMYEQPQQVAQRFRLFRFAQRRFRHAERSAAADIEVSLRGFYRMPALLLALERMGARSPAAFAVVVQSARTLTTAADPEDLEPEMIRFQGALSLLEQVTRHRPLPAAAVEAALQQLASTVTKRVRESGAASAWLFDSLLPALIPESTTIESESTLVSALVLSRSGADDTITWEGLRYRIDRGAPVVRDALAVRSADRNVTLAELAALHGIRRQLERPTPTLEQVRTIATELRRLQPILAELKVDNERVLPEVRQLERVARTLSRVKTARDAARASRQLPAILAAIDAVTTRVVPAIAYALAVAPTPQPRIYADIAARHAFWVKEDGIPWRDAVWSGATLETQAGAGLRVRGSLLTLDVPLAESQTRLLPGSRPPSEPSFNPADHRAYITRLVLRHVGDDQPSADMVVRALESARARLGSAVAQAGEGGEAPVAALRDAGISQTRINLLSWSWKRGNASAALERLSPRELVYLGTSNDLPSLLAVPALPFDACICLRVPERRPVEELTGHAATGVMVTELADLQIRIIELLHEIGLPAKLMEPLLPFAVTETVANISQFHHDDWSALRVTSLLTRERMEEYLLGLVAEGVLAPPR